MSFFSEELRKRLEEVGEQELADDPRVIAIFQTPLVDLTFYITGYNAKEDEYIGYAKGEGIDNWVAVSRQRIDMMYEIMQKMPPEDQKYPLLKGEPPISQLVPETREHVIIARLNILMEEHEKKKEQNRGQEPER